MFENIPQISLSVMRERKVPYAQLLSVTNSADMANIARKMYSQDTLLYQEQFHVYLFNRANKIVAHRLLSIGSSTGTVVDRATIARIAIKCMANSVILVHNHPSGNIKPSDADKTLTKSIKEGLALFGVSLLDHLIITEEHYLSMADEGLL